MPRWPTSYRTTFLVLAAVAVVGIVWEFIYHFLMQFRWEKDWPSMFGLLLIVPEGVLMWFLLDLGVVPFIESPPTACGFRHPLRGRLAVRVAIR